MYIQRPLVILPQNTNKKEMKCLRRDCVLYITDKKMRLNMGKKNKQTYNWIFFKFKYNLAIAIF